MGSEFGITSDTKPELRLGALGIFWMVFTAVWTVILLAGMIFLWIQREMPILRIRGLPLSFAAIALMHLYWIAVQLAYWYGPLMPEVAEFWIMSIWFPFGIALFHASNSRFLYVADAQRRFIQKSEAPSLPVARGDLLGRWRQLDYNRRILISVCTGMGLHFLLTLAMFLISRKFHDSFGVSGTEVHGTYMERKVAQGRGWEWWPSIFWQMFWAWIFAPYILFRARKLRDTQGWRFQTIACCISNLHSSPMWLVALYVPAMESVNNYFIPPQWIAVSIMLLEIFTVFVPVVEVCKHRALTQETLNSIAHWESRKKGISGGDKSINSGLTRSSWAGRIRRASSVHTSSSGGSILTMEALELTLAKNPEPLQQFSALRDFSGENIAFLTSVREWKATYFPATKESEKDDGAVKELPRECFESALKIYVDFISATHAEFQINLSSTDFKSLEAVFDHAASVICGSERSNPDPCAPFDAVPHRADSESTLNIVRYWGQVPIEFNENVFADAETSIKYLVLTNTWPKFIKERRSFDMASTIETGSN
ncbi:regulator of g signaling superfamily [Trichoderma cornu-damae]|uniref:Regulator of g signaling superfamily n=1 Tax=Trichoderma cornu-damae TaxID=654480 RepID=A0A9P8QMR8_9HYPO|nr:regulator of g signaling superfamily [Trichoderma cornu-damae]